MTREKKDGGKFEVCKVAKIQPFVGNYMRQLKVIKSVDGMKQRKFD